MIETAAKQLANKIQAEFPSITPPTDWIWDKSPSAKVIDCVLSLRKNYATTVEPRVKRFVAEHPGVRELPDLRALIQGFDSPEQFMGQVLDMRSPTKASAIVGTVDYLMDAVTRFDGHSEEARLTSWARWAHPGDYLAMGVKGVGLAGFQYLRMLFGADTVKPDVHILNYVEQAIGERPSDIKAVYIVERAGELLDVPVKHLDVAIWTRGSSGSSLCRRSSE